LILIEDLDGAENVLYPLRELQSKRRITKTVTLKDNKGNLKTITLKVEGPVCVSSCTTRERIYEDNANRCILLYIDDSHDQDRRIMSYQQKASAGNINASEESQITEKIKNVQRLLKPIKIVNPYAEIIDLPQEVFKPRRTLLLLLSFIETITFYHQHQRTVKTDSQSGVQYIETNKEDIEAAFSLLKEALFSKSDELTKASRKFLESLKKEVKPGEIFFSSQIRKKLRLTPATLKRYLFELTRNGYIKIKGGSKYRGFEYEIIDYEEYENLRSNIDAKLAEILAKIK
jgi:DNA-binding MarR family transcriptional regulator